jgi:hypothetical protein
MDAIRHRSLAPIDRSLDAGPTGHASTQAAYAAQRAEGDLTMDQPDASAPRPSQTGTRQFNVGDRVIHPRRPEWGTGKVEQSQPIIHKGATAQRLTVTFENHGKLNINTGVVGLMPESEAGHLRAEGAGQDPAEQEDQSSGGWLGRLEAKVRTADGLTSLPPAMTDPFISLPKRLKATLESFRFNGDARGLLDWAVVQTGLADPLSRYSRPELEQGFEHFKIRRDNHLRDLINTLRKKGEQKAVTDALASVKIPAAEAAVKRIMR